MQDMNQEAQLLALMAISKARDCGKIKKRNMLKLDRKVNEMLSRFLLEQGSKY